MASTSRTTRGSIVERGPDRWLVRIFLGRDTTGKRVYYSKTIRGSNRDARVILDGLLAEADRERQNPGQPAVVTVGDFFDDWLDQVAETRRQRTVEGYRNVLDTYVRPHVGAKLLRELTSEDVKRLLTRLVKNGNGMARPVRDVLRNALASAMADGLITANPVVGRAVSAVLPKSERKERQVLTPDGAKRFAENAAADPLHALWLVLLTGGLRPSEALALRWADLHESTVTINRSLSEGPKGRHTFEPTKSHSSRRSVQLSQVAVNALDLHRRLQDVTRYANRRKWNDLDLMFCNELGSPLKQAVVRNGLKRLLKGAGLPPMRVYDLRHSMATLALGAGVPMKVVQERLGHSSIVLTADTYSHVDPGMQQQAAERLDRLF